MSGESPSYGSIETGESPSYPARKNDSTTKLVTVVLCATAAVMLVRVALRRACASTLWLILALTHLPHQAIARTSPPTTADVITPAEHAGTCCLGAARRSRAPVR